MQRRTRRGASRTRLAAALAVIGLGGVALAWSIPRLRARLARDRHGAIDTLSRAQTRWAEAEAGVAPEAAPATDVDAVEPTAELAPPAGS